MTTILQNDPPRTGRVVGEDGTVVNMADVGAATSLLDPTALALRGQSYFFNNIRRNVPSADEFYYYIRAPADKSVAITFREIKAAEGEVVLDTILAPTSVTGGASYQAPNFYVGGPPHESEILINPSVTGGITVPADIVFREGNRAVAGAEVHGPTIIPPGFEFVARILNESTGSNSGISFTIIFAELEIPLQPALK